MVNTFKEGRDIYATIGSIAFNVPYEDCLEFHPVTHEYQPDGKLRRTRSKPMVLGINYGMEAKALGEKIFGDDDSISEEEKTATAKKVFDAVMSGFPVLKKAIADCRTRTKQIGYSETILGRRRHFPNIQMPMYTFKPEKGYINPDVDPMNIDTLEDINEIPQRIKDALYKELTSYKYMGQVYKRIRQLSEEEHIKVLNNSSKIAEAERECWNHVIQGSSADLTKMAMLRLETDPEWIEIGGRLILPVHDELIVEVPFEHREKGAEILKRSMEQAGNFLPFTISCDIEMTFRWYGLEVDDILSFDKPNNLDFDTMSESNVKWLQSRLFEQGYVFPVIKNPDGSKPIGIAAKGINGVVTDELKAATLAYRALYGLKSDEQLIEHIDVLVTTGKCLTLEELSS